MAKTGRGVASPRPPCLGVQGEALPLPAGGARERQRGQHVVLSLPEAARLARSANPTSIQSEKGDRGLGCWQANGRDAVAPLPAVS